MKGRLLSLGARRSAGAEGALETSRLLPRGSGVQELPVSYGPESSTEPSSGNVQQTSGAEGTQPQTACGDLEKWPLLHTGSHHLDRTCCCAKYLLFFSNFGFSVLGLLTLGVGVWGLIYKESLVEERLQLLGSDPMLLVVLVGLVTSVVSVAGCTGALRENATLLKFFTVVVVAFVVLQVLAGIVLYTLRGQIGDSLAGAMRLAIERYQDDTDMKFIMDEIQLGLECCGVDTYRDWRLNLYFNCSSPGANACGVPFSCCIDPLQNGTVANSQCGFGVLAAEEIAAQNIVYLGGCVPQLARWLNMNMGLIGFAVAILLVTEVVSLILATRILGDIELIKSQW